MVRGIKSRSGFSETGVKMSLTHFPTNDSSLSIVRTFLVRRNKEKIPCFYYDGKILGWLLFWACLPVGGQEKSRGRTVLRRLGGGFQNNY